MSNGELMAAKSLIQRGDRREKETTMLAPEEMSVAATALEWIISELESMFD